MEQREAKPPPRIGRKPPAQEERPKIETAEKPSGSRPAPAPDVGWGKKLLIGLGVMAAPAAVGVIFGYVIAKFEDKLMSDGMGLVIQWLKSAANGRGFNGTAWGRGASRFHDRDQRRHHDSQYDPMGEGGDQDLPEDDRI